MTRMEKISKYLGEKEWLNGEITVVDFYLAEIINRGQHFSKGQLGKKYTNLVSFLERFNNLPLVKEYL